MGNVDLWQASFNGGELTPLVEGREDITRYPTGCRRLRNAHGLIQGPARRRMGGRFVGEVKDNGQAWLVPFIRSRRLAYILEYGDEYIRFFRDRGRIMDPVPPDPYEIVSPWTYADLVADDGTLAIHFTQSIDVLYNADGTMPVQQLIRTDDDDWDLVDFDTVGGPFDSQNTTATTVYASAQSGTVTLTASTAIFTADRIGSLFRIQPQDSSDIPPWEPNQHVATNVLRRNGGKTYKATTAGVTDALGQRITGTVGLIHEIGTEKDGDGDALDPKSNAGARTETGIDWEFQDPGYGVLKITGVGGGGTTATATVEPWRVGSNALLPFYTVLVANLTTRWNWGVFSLANGYPTDVSFFRERFVMGNDRQYAFSVPAGFTEFAQELAGQVLPDNAFVVDLTSDRDETTEWIKPAHDRLIIGTTGGEHMLGEMTTQQVFGPLNRKSEPKTGHSSNGVAPVRAGDQLLFLEGNSLRVRATEASGDAFAAPSQNDLAEHITFGGVIAQAFQEKPDSLAWYLTAEGALPCLTYSKEQDVFGWSQHFIGGYRDASHARAAKVTSAAVIPSPDGSADDLWYIAERYIDGGLKRYIEFITPAAPKPQRWEFETAEAFKRRVLDWQADLVYLDSAATYDVPLTILSITKVGAVLRVGVTAHGMSNGDYVRHDLIMGMWQLNARGFQVTNVAANTYDLVGIDAADVADYISGGFAREMVTTISNLEPWEGETLQVITDGATHPDRTVVSGSISLQYRAARVHTGYNARCTIETMRPIGGNDQGSGQGKHGSITRTILRVEATLGGKIGPDDDNLDVINYRTPQDPMGIAVPVFTGDIEFDFPGEVNTVRTVVIVQDQPLPLTVIGLGTAMEVESE